MKYLTAFPLRLAGLLCALCVALVPLANAASPAAAPASAPVPLVYDAGKDRVSVRADNVQLSQLLKSLAHQSSLEIRFDPAADRPLTIEFSAMPLEDAADRLTSGLNVMKQYRTTKASKKTNMLVGFTVLPAGKTDASAAGTLVDSRQELGARAVQRARFEGAQRDGKAQAGNRAVERWDERLKTATPDQRKQYENALEKARANEKRSAERRAERDAARAKQAEERQQRLEANRTRAGARGVPEPNPDARARVQQMFPQNNGPSALPEE